MGPRATVLLPVRDAAPWLGEALGSILAEPMPDLEVVAVDDGSRDGSPAILADAARRDSRVTLLTTAGAGVVAALNLGLARARAPIVVRMDADDRSLPGRIPALLQLLETRPDLAAAGSGVVLHPAGDRRGGMRRYVDWLNAIDEPSLPREIWVESPLAHPTLAARRDVLLAAGGYRPGPFAEDYDLLLRLHLAGRRLGKVAEVLYWWRDHGARLTRRDPRYAPATFRTLKAGALRRGPLRDVTRVAVWGAGKTGKPFARALAAAGFEIAAWIEVDPRRIGTTLAAAPVLAVADLERLAGTPILVAVGAAGARELIRAALAARGFEELRDFWVVA